LTYKIHFLRIFAPYVETWHAMSLLARGIAAEPP
jgi:hypothetical protein